MKRKQEWFRSTLSIFWSVGLGFLFEIGIIGGLYLEKKTGIGLPVGGVLEFGWIELLKFGLVLGASVMLGRKLEERKAKGNGGGFSQNQNSVKIYGSGKIGDLSGWERRKKGRSCLLKAGEVIFLLGGAMILVAGCWFLVLKVFGLFAFDEKIGLLPVYVICLSGFLVAFLALRRSGG